MKIFFSVGEPSGDLHGANLIAELRSQQPDLELCGFGGPRMSAAGCALIADLTEYAVMWFWRVIILLPRFLSFLSQADRFFKTQRPDAVILIDFPGFNWWIARRAKVHGIPVFYYGVPQLWAWAPWRVRKLRKYADHVLCKLPFEPEWFASRGCNAHYVGHPYFDELADRELDENFVASMRRPPHLVTLLPGSRQQEVTANLPMMLAACRKISANIPAVRFAIASYNESQAAISRQAIVDNEVDAEVFIHRTPELIAAATACIACSGSVSLELLHHEKPAVIVYRVSRLAFAVQERARLAKYISLVNLLACREIDRRSSTTEKVPFPEYLTCEDESSNIAKDIILWLRDEPRRLETVQQLYQLRANYAHAGASRRAAAYIHRHLQPKSNSPPRPHFRPRRPTNDLSIR